MKEEPANAANQLVNWLFLDLNSFFASCEQQMHPHLRGRPIAVVPSLAPTTCAIAASYEAKKCGVKTGTLLHEAKRLCPNIIFVVGKHGQYAHFHHRILEEVEKVLPIECVFSIDEFAIRLMGDERQVPHALMLAKQIKQVIETKVGACLTSSVGLAPNKFLAKLASDMQKPNGLTVLTMADLPHKIAHLPVQDLTGVGPRMAQRLAAYGVFTVEQLYSASEPTMRAMWGGIEGAKMYAKLRGVDPYYRPTQTRGLSHQHVLEPALRHKEGLLSVSQHLLLKAAERLRRKGYFAKNMALSIKWQKGQQFTKTHAETSFTEMNDSLSLLRILNSQLLAGAMRHAVATGCAPFRITIALHGFVPIGAHQPDLFAETPRLENAKISQALDDINAKYGRGTLVFGASHALKQKSPSTQTGANIAFSYVPQAGEYG